MKKIHIISTFLLIFLFFAIGCQTLAEMDESADINRGWRQHRRGDYKWAIMSFNLALRDNPQSAGAYAGLAMTWEDLGDFDKAKEYFSKAVELDPRSKFYYDVGSNKAESEDIRRGWRHYRYGEFSQAITSFNLALQKNSQSAEAYNGLGMTLEDKGDYDQAVEYFSKAIEIEPKSGYFWLQGEAWRRKRDFGRAIEDYTNTISMDPAFAAAYADRGSCYMSVGKYEAALKDYDKVLELTPTDDQRPYAVRARKIALEAIADLQKKLKKT